MEITEFFTTETLEAIDWGVLDLRESLMWNPFPHYTFLKPFLSGNLRKTT